jgi:hypothetical protein
LHHVSDDSGEIPGLLFLCKKPGRLSLFHQVRFELRDGIPEFFRREFNL